MAVNGHFCHFKLHFLDTSGVEPFFRTPIIYENMSLAISHWHAHLFPIDLYD